MEFLQESLAAGKRSSAGSCFVSFMVNTARVLGMLTGKWKTPAGAASDSAWRLASFNPGSVGPFCGKPLGMTDDSY